MSKGSTWNVWDFHLHTPHSILNNQFGDPDDDETWEKYISEVERITSEKGIVAVGFTDYFTIEGYKKVLQFKERGRLENVLAFPNIEFRLNVSVNERRLNIHVLFSPDVKPERVEENFLHDLDFVHENDPFEGPQIRKLKISNLTEFGNNTQQQHERFSGLKPFQVGCMTAVVDYMQVNETLIKNFRGDYLIALAEENLSALDWDSQYHAIRKQLIQMSHVVFSANPNSRDFYLGKKHSQPEEYMAEFKSYKPCIWGCDSHGYNERFLEPDLERLCWIKAETTWNGLKQILYEPEHRVIIQKHNPEPNKNIYSLSTIQIQQTELNENLSINDVDIDINPNLVAIIGGRGSGKTALLDLVASCFREGDKLNTLEQSFFYRIFVEADSRQISEEAIRVNLGFISGDEFSRRIGSDNDECCFEKSDIIYLTQNHFEEFSARPNKLNEHIIDLIYEKYPAEKREYESGHKEIRNLIREIQNINLSIQQLETEIEGERQEAEVELKIKHGEQTDYLNRISAIEKQVETKRDDLRALTEKQNATKAKIRQIVRLVQNIHELMERISSFSGYLQEKADSINHELIDVFPDKPDYYLPKSLPALDLYSKQLSDLLERLLEESTKQQELLVDVNNQIDDLEGISKEIADLHVQLNEISFQIQETQEKLAYIESTEKRIRELDGKRFTKYGVLIHRMINLRIYLQQMIDKFETGKSEMLNNLSFTSTVEFHDQRKYIQTLSDKVDNRSHSEAALRKKFHPIFNSLSDVLNGDKLDPDLEELIGSLSDISRILKLKGTTTSSDYYNAVLTPFFEIGLLIKFNDRILRDLSMGERAIVLLKVLLALDDTPLFIDQPEEHLDNRYIYNELMPAFRSAKNNRQIIIATHNANLVVNTDAEQIIVASSDNGNLSYHVGTLEDPDTSEMIKTLLEGGDDAFKKREQKYGYVF